MEEARERQFWNALDGEKFDADERHASAERKRMKIPVLAGVGVLLTLSGLKNRGAKSPAT